MAYELHTVTRRRNSKPFISITKSKSFGFPGSFIKEYKLEKGMKAVILYDKDSRSIGLHFSGEALKNGYALHLDKNPAYGGSLVSRSFFESKNIDTNHYAGRYGFKVQKLEEIGFMGKTGDVFIINLDDKDGNKNVSSSSGGIVGETPNPEF